MKYARMTFGSFLRIRVPDPFQILCNCTSPVSGDVPLYQRIHRDRKPLNDVDGKWTWALVLAYITED